jgi:hypothetical protein
VIRTGRATQPDRLQRWLAAPLDVLIHSHPTGLSRLRRLGDKHDESEEARAWSAAWREAEEARALPKELTLRLVSLAEAAL